MRAWHLLPLLALLASFSIGCGGGDTSPSGPTGAGDTPSDPVLQTPHPANVSVTLDASHGTSARIPTSGGTLQATGADGTVFTLTIPAGALLVDTTITMTPLADASGLNISGAHMAGVQLEPDGLEFYQVANLRVAPPEGAHTARWRSRIMAREAKCTGFRSCRIPTCWRSPFYTSAVLWCMWA